MDTARFIRCVGNPKTRSDGQGDVDELVQTEVWSNRAVVCDAGVA